MRISNHFISQFLEIKAKKKEIEDEYKKFCTILKDSEFESSLYKLKHIECEARSIDLDGLVNKFGNAVNKFVKFTSYVRIDIEIKSKTYQRLINEKTRL